jgi:hypothetical protein
VLGGCGGGGGGSSAPPAPTPDPPAPTEAAIDDSATTVEDTRLDISVLANDSNVDAASLTISQQPSNGAATVVGSTIQYIPAANFSGTDELVYAVSGTSGEQLTATVSISITAVTETQLSTEILTIPTTGYAAQNSTELGATILVSPAIEFTIAPNPVSFALALVGDDVNDTGTDLFITEVTSPDGASFNPLQRNVTFCDPGFCSGLIPRRPDQIATQGTWTLRVGTLASTTNGIDFSQIQLSTGQRIGPEPNLTANPVLRVRPFLTATSISNSELELVLNQLQTMAAASGLNLTLDPIQTITDPAFAEVPREFSAAQTAQLVEMGAADRINLFFLEDFSGVGGTGLLGISGGIPGPLGSNNRHNGVLINATASRGDPDALFARNTAEIALHEMGHFLGLYHTTERQFDPHDVIDDTPECTSDLDRTSVGIQGVADVLECPDGQNLMFWNTDFSGNKQPLSADQREVIARSPLALPGT